MACDCTDGDEHLIGGAVKMSQGKRRILRNLDVSPVRGGKSQRVVRKLWLETLETRTLLSATLGVEPQAADTPGQAAASGRLSANALERAPWVAGLGWQVSKDAFAVPQEATTDLALRGATPPALPAAPARSAAAADGSVGLQAGSPAGQAPLGATVSDPSEFMIGDVWVTLVLLESNGAVDAQTENWSTTRIGQVKDEVLEGTQWWEDTLLAQFPNSLQELNISVDFTYADAPVPTAYEPINHGIADQSLWIDSFLNHVGYNTASSVFTDLDTWNHAQRLAHNADWALTAFVVDSLADADGKFSDGYFAYAYLGGPFLMMTYDNNGWGNSRMGQVFAHEFAHIFYALDEYPGSTTYTTTSGYYNIQNLNAYDGNPNPASRVSSLMADSSLQGPAYTNHTSSPTSLQMIGWRDSDSDGVFDVLDVPLTLTGSGSYNAAAAQYSFSGSSNVNTLQNLNPYGYRHNITINTVDALQYRIDGNAWISGNTYDAYSTGVSQVVNVSGLAAGTHTIDFRTIVDTLNVPSNVISGSFTVVGSNAPPVASPDAATTNEDTPAVLAVLGNDSDADGDLLTIQSVAQGMHGTVVIGPNGTLTYSPSANYHGGDSFTYTVSDGRGGTGTAIVNMTIASVNDPPVAIQDSVAATVGTPVTIAVLANDWDVDGDPLSVAAVTQGAGGSVAVDAGGTLTYTPGADFSGSDAFTYTVSDGSGGTATASVSVQVQAAVKFFVVDNSADDTFRYNAAGQYVSRSDLNAKNTDPRGVTTTADGQKIWVLNYSKIVYVYNPAGALLGSWSSSQLKQPVGIATDGTNIWIVDKSTDTVYRYNNAASVTAGALTANSTFKLASGNTTPEGITTDGTKLWVVNSGNPDKVFVYNLTGGSLGSWTIDAANRSPTGLTIDPTGASQSIWIVDVSKDRVYEYANARSRTSGSQMAGVSFALASGNTSPQDIADPDGSLRALSAAAAPEMAGILTTASDAWETPVAAWQVVAFDTRRADSTLFQSVLVDVEGREESPRIQIRRVEIRGICLLGLQHNATLKFANGPLDFLPQPFPQAIHSLSVKALVDSNVGHPLAGFMNSISVDSATDVFADWIVALSSGGG